MTWDARLNLRYQSQGDRTLAHFEHSGPLRILQSLYPEGTGVCHNVLIHPPGGLVGGDSLELNVRVAPHAHGLITTPGATRFYASEGEAAAQRTRLHLEPGARLEWLPLESLCYSGCIAHNQLRMELAPGAELLGWDVCALGLPQAGQPFERGQLLQELELPGVWLERGLIAAHDERLMNSPLGLAGQRCLGTLFFASGSALPTQRCEQGLALARQAIDIDPLSAWAGATQPHPQVMLVRVLAPMVEPAMALLRRIWSLWRTYFWQLPACAPRVWAM